jgi:hypothetical protein
LPRSKLSACRRSCSQSERDPKEIVVTVPRHGLMLNLRREEVKVS